MNNLLGLIPVLYAALQVVSRELVGFIPSTSMSLTANEAALNQPIRIPKTPETDNLDITPGTPPIPTGTDFDYVDMAITKNKIARPIVWNGDEQVSVGNQLNAMMVNQFAQAMRSLVNEVERDVCLEATIGALQGGNVYGTAEVTPFASNLTDIAQVRKIQDDLGTPKSDRHLLINTATGANIRSLTQLTNVNQSADQSLLRQGVILDLMGYAIRESSGFRFMDTGTVSSFGLSAAAAAGSTALAINSTIGDINPGAIIDIGGFYYTVTAPALPGATTINIAPALRENASSGQAGIVINNYMPNVAFSRDFIYLATRTPLMTKEGDDAKDVRVITDPVSGLSFQVVLYGDYRQVRIEIGMAWGVKAINNRHGLLLLG